MTLAEKRILLNDFCIGRDCEDCVFRHGWCEHYNTNSIPEDELDAALKKIGLLPHTQNNSVDHPSHYNQGGIECIDAMEAAFGKEAVKNFCLLNAFKYVWRTRDKNGDEDIDKAIWYLCKVKELNSSE